MEAEVSVELRQPSSQLPTCWLAEEPGATQGMHREAGWRVQYT